ncbi:L-PSP endoribonuclease family protein [Penicillium brasilianum]|uniref:L-PSP endoribonuclease family protein n=1 Tax=Penicillium brasilianum TaxID=104259 RepID=A0A1S9R9T7_PENBI|nr:L-PSP endoribonuclease family protein [Penicillium brasilianum]
MAHLQFYNYEGVGEKNQQDYWYSQAVRIGDRIECAGQGGWDPKSGEISQEINAEIDQAFENVDLNLKHAGGNGWDQVFRVNSYHVPMDNEALGAMVRNFKKWMPGHQPIWTCVGVPSLAQDNMHVEIEVVAHVP